MGLLKVVFKIVGVLVLAVIGLAAFLYFTDYQAEATITEKGRDGSGDFVIIRPRVIPMDIQQSVDQQAAAFVCVGYKVTYRIQSQHFQVLEPDGDVVYDSNDGLVDPTARVRCGTLL